MNYQIKLEILDPSKEMQELGCKNKMKKKVQ
jgi:hypothetical protein